MKSTTHPAAPEEVMALADGELDAQKAETVSAHVRDCKECSDILHSVMHTSRAMAAWGIESVSLGRVQNLKLLAGVKEKSRSSPLRQLGSVVGALCIVGLLLVFATPNLMRSRMAANEASAVGSLRTVNTAAATYLNTYGHYPVSLEKFGPSPTGHASEDAADLIDAALAGGRKSGYLFLYRAHPGFGAHGGYAVSADPVEPGKTGTRHFSTDQSGVIRTGDGELLGGMPGSQNEPPTPVAQEDPAGTPMIEQAAEVRIAVTKLDVARASMEQIVTSHRGYIGSLSATQDSASAEVVAGLLVPRDEMNVCLTELKGLGRVTEESQSGEDVSRRHIDLVARLDNSRNTETRINELIRRHTGNVKDVLEAEKEAARVRGEIERMEAQRKSMDQQVQFAKISVALSEVYRATLSSETPGAAERIHNAWVGGLRDGRESALGIFVCVISILPTMVLWAAVLFLPARWSWRRWRAAFY